MRKLRLYCVTGNVLKGQRDKNREFQYEMVEECRYLGTVVNGLNERDGEYQAGYRR